MDPICVREVLIGVFHVVDQHVGTQEARKAQCKAEHINDRMKLPRKERPYCSLQMVKQHWSVADQSVASAIQMANSLAGTIRPSTMFTILSAWAL